MSLEMNKILDLTTKVTKQALDVLFFSNPFRTSMGVLLGVFLHEFSTFIVIVVKSTTNLSFPPISLMGWLAFSIFILNAQFLFRKRSEIPEEIRILIDSIQESKRAGVSEAEIQSQYRILFQKCTEISLKPKVQSELDHMKEVLDK